MVYNVAAAFFAARELGVDTAFYSLRSMPTSRRRTAWAAGDRRPYRRGKPGQNPVGFDRQIQSIKTAGGRLCAFFLNDNDADGHDVSWIYDVDF
ncbi:MAG: MurT ligase domain-containing protein [Collinsella sp.]